MNQIIIISVI